MKKYILSLLVTTTLSYAGLINAIALIINDTPVTLYDIDVKMKNNNITKQEAVNRLIDEALYNQELKNNNINVDIFDIDNHIKKLAAKNKMNILDFKSLVRQQRNYEIFTQQIKQTLLHKKLVAKISRGKIKLASEDDMKMYYENNKAKYKIADTIDTIAYISKDKNLLNKIKNNPMMKSDKVMMQNLTFKQSELTPQVKYILNSTNEKDFSVIFAQNKNYNMFFVIDKKDIKVLKYDDVKDQIFSTLMKQREQNYLKEYFETLKITANIQILK